MVDFMGRGSSRYKDAEGPERMVSGVCGQSGGESKYSEERWREALESKFLLFDTHVGEHVLHYPHTPQTSRCTYMLSKE